MKNEIDAAKGAAETESETVATTRTLTTQAAQKALELAQQEAKTLEVLKVDSAQIRWSGLFDFYDLCHWHCRIEG